ncbi:MAG: ATP-binding protein [Clostridiales Family XIII bacterium]|jgi:predicted AAA+ superfamily ATPase|nr:ATP-binding protein [Clostridiales Family XIII bacterium]
MNEKGIDQLILYSEFANEALVRKTCALFQWFISSKSGKAPIEPVLDRIEPLTYYEVQRGLLDARGRLPLGSGATVWQDYIADLVCSADNAFSRLAERGADDKQLWELAAEELRVIKRLYHIDFGALAKAVEKKTGIRAGAENIAGSRQPPGEGRSAERLRRIHAAFAAESEEEGVRLLADSYRAFGSGTFAASAAFLWDGSLAPAPYDESVTMDSLIGYERQKALLIENAELLIAGLPASNVLLYGDSGTGKSSSVKALLNVFADRGLKLISLPKARLAEITGAIDLISGRGLKFIVFIDDLSFDEGENGYKAFKSAIEGRIEAANKNWIVCVTSNRRNIVKEVWKDRETQDDVHLRDNLQEKKSLADRFGLTIIYEAPDKNEYLGIVRGLAGRAGLALSSGELDEAALTWEIRHGGRSGRTAKGFVDHLYALEHKNNEGGQNE